MPTANRGSAFDIVTVPDFASGARHAFVGRTLLFLASWMEHAGEARALPLHVACIGEPPETVRRMADRAGAILSVHEPMILANAHTANKLRGFEVERRTERILLLDTDTVFLGDVSPFCDLPDHVSAAAADGARVPIKLWRRLYPAVDLEFPAERIPLLRGELDMPPHLREREDYEHQFAEMAESPPYFNSGVVFASWDHELPALWADCLMRGAQIVDPSEPGSHGVLGSDQAAFALAVATLRARGVEFRRLPDVMHARWRHFYRGRPAPDEIRILHCIDMMRNVTSPGELASTGPLDRWCGETRSRFVSLFWADVVRRGRPLTGLKRCLRGRRLMTDIHQRLLKICRHQLEGGQGRSRKTN